jgi:hypothetical protein
VKKSKLSPGSKVWLYARHSPGTGQTIYNQLQELREYCQANGLIVAHEFIDAGESGSSRNREQFGLMMEAAETNRVKMVDGIIIYDSTRLARNLEDAQGFRWLIRRRGYALEWLIGEQPDGVVGDVMAVIRDHQNAEFLEILRQKSATGMRRMFQLRDATGDYLGFFPGRVPWGFRGVKRALPGVVDMHGKERVRQCIEPDYDQWPVGQKLYELRANGYTYSEIEQMTGFFASRGTIDVDNNNGLITAYGDYFQNQLYYGLLVYGRKPYETITIPDYVPAMVNEQVWRQANACSEVSKRGGWTGWKHSRTGKGRKTDFILGGLCRCALCGGVLYSIYPTKKFHYYLCRNRKRYGLDGCEAQYIRAEELEAAVLDHIEQYYLSGEFVQMVIEEIENLLDDAPAVDQEADRIKREIADIEQRIGNLLKLAESGQVEEAWTRIGELKRQKKGKQQRLEELHSLDSFSRFTVDVSAVDAAMADLRQRLTQLGEMRAVLRQIIDRIVAVKERATIFYRLPLAISGGFHLEILDILQVGYVIELPSGASVEAGR